MSSKVTLDSSGKLTLRKAPRAIGSGRYWCNAHNRFATQKGKDGLYRCDSNLPGLMITCQVVDLEGIAVIEET